MTDIPGQPAPVTPTVSGPSDDGFVPRCPHCDYILLGLAVERCPECGRRFSLAQLRRMYLRRRPPPWEDSNYRGSAARRYMATWRAMMRPPFFLFLAPGDRRRQATRFVVVTCAVTMAVSLTAVAAMVATPPVFSQFLWGILEGVDWLFRTPAFAWARRWPPGIPSVGVAELFAGCAVFIPSLLMAWMVVCRIVVAMSGTPEQVVGQGPPVAQVVAYLSCWLLAGLAVFAVGVLLAVLAQWTVPRQFPPVFVLVCAYVTDGILAALWFCQADAALRDALGYRSVWPALVVLTLGLFAAFAVAAGLAYGVMLAVAVLWW